MENETSNFIGFKSLMMAGIASADGTASGSGYGEAAACANAKTNARADLNGIPDSECTCDAPKSENGKWYCYVDYTSRSSSYSSSSSNSSSYSSGSSSYSSPSYTPSYGGSSGRFTPTQIPQRNPYVLSGQR